MRFVLSVALLFAWGAAAYGADTAGQELTPWQPGTLDIHQISTGRGNSALFILPDGTTMLVDAGELPFKTPKHTPDRPDDTRRAGEWIVRYLRHALRHDPQPSLDYAIMTHFHDDHMGSSKDAPMSSSNTYYLAGVTTVGENLKIGKMLDRGWPDYRYPTPQDSPMVKNYRAFLAWQAEHRGMKVERFAAGRNDQVVLCRDPKKHGDFELRNVGVNGEIWTGVGTATRCHIPPLETVARADWPHENLFSIVFRVSYGKFDYYSGGDIPGVVPPGYPVWYDLETPVAKAVGPVEAAILDHHGYVDTQNEFFIATLRPRVWLISVWDSCHPTLPVWQRLNSSRLYSGPRDIFATDVHPAARLTLGGIERIASDQGHIVLRVAPGGDAFRVAVVDDTSESHRVKKVFGPYPSR